MLCACKCIGNHDTIFQTKILISLTSKEAYFAFFEIKRTLQSSGDDVREVFDEDFIATIGFSPNVVASVSAVKVAEFFKFGYIVINKVFAYRKTKHYFSFCGFHSERGAALKKLLVRKLLIHEGDAIGLFGYVEV